MFVIITLRASDWRIMQTSSNLKQVSETFLINMNSFWRVFSTKNIISTLHSPCLLLILRVSLHFYDKIMLIFGARVENCLWSYSLWLSSCR